MKTKDRLRYAKKLDAAVAETNRTGDPRTFLTTLGDILGKEVARVFRDKKPKKFTRAELERLIRDTKFQAKLLDIVPDAKTIGVKVFSSKSERAVLLYHGSVARRGCFETIRVGNRRVRVLLIFCSTLPGIHLVRK